jgi:hypothetical protein
MGYEEEEGDESSGFSWTTIALGVAFVAALIVGIVFIALYVQAKAAPPNVVMVDTAKCTAVDTGVCIGYVAPTSSGSSTAIATSTTSGTDTATATTSATSTATDTATAQSGAGLAPILGLFTAMPNVDFTGNDISQVSGDMPTVAAACSANPKCVGFNSSGWLKSAATGAGTPQKGVTFYKFPFTIMKNIDYPGNDISQMDGPAGLAACLANPQCKGVNSSGWLKSAASGAGSPQKGVTFYKKI